MADTRDPEAAALEWLESPRNPPGSINRLRERGALAGLDHDDAYLVTATIINALTWPGGYNPGDAFRPLPTQDLRHSVNSLRQKAANVAGGSDLQRNWHDRVAVSHAFAKAADALNIGTPVKVDLAK